MQKKKKKKVKGVATSIRLEKPNRIIFIFKKFKNKLFYFFLKFK